MVFFVFWGPPLSTATADPPSEVYVSAADAIRRHPRLNRVKLYKLALSRQVKCKLPPGTPPRYRLSDLDRIMGSLGA